MQITENAEKTFSRYLVMFTENLLAHGLPILYFLISVAFYLRTYDSAQIKITLIQIGGAILLAAWLIKIIEINIGKFIKHNFVILIPVFLFLISGISSYIISPFTLASLNELIRRVIYIGIVFIVAHEFDSEEKFKRLFKWLFAAAFVATIYGMIQYLDYKYFPSGPEQGLDPFIWRGAFGNRIFSTFGNPNFFGDFLVVLSPLTLAMFLYNRRPHQFLLWLLVVFCAVFTYSKGTWLGFAVGFTVFVFLSLGFFLQVQKVNVKKILMGLMIATILLSLTGVFTQLKKRPDSASFRLFTWLSQWEMINTGPWLGTGIGTFYVTYPAWRRPQIFFIEGRHNTETDHPENEYLEVWYDEGFVGMGIFLWLLLLYILLSFNNLSVFSRTFEGQKKTRDIRAYIQLGVLSALAAQLAHNYVCVSLRFVSSGIFLWLLIGLIAALSIHNPLPKKSPELEPDTNPIPESARRGMQLVIILVCIYLVKVFYGYFSADVHHNLAIFYSKQRNWDQALAHYNQVVKKNPSFIMAHYFMGNVFNDRWGSGDAARSIEKYEDVWKLAPNYVQSRHQAGLIYLKWGEDEKREADSAMQRGDQKSAADHENKKVELWNKAMVEFEKYRTIDPVFPLNYYRMAWIYMQLGLKEKAKEIYLAHLEYPAKLQKPPHSIWVEDWAVRRAPEYAETATNVGNLYFMDNDLANAQKYYKIAINLDSNSVNALKNLAVLFSREGGHVEEMQQIGMKLLQLAPEDPDVKRMFKLERR